jgi:hypothetical protein
VSTFSPVESADHELPSGPLREPLVRRRPQERRRWDSNPGKRVLPRVRALYGQNVDLMAGLDRLTVAVRDRGGIPMLQAARRWTLVAVVVLVAVPLLVGSPVGASPTRVTRGDAEAVFKASSRGGDLDLRVQIMPFFENGRHYCVENCTSSCSGSSTAATRPIRARMPKPPSTQLSLVVASGSPSGVDHAACGWSVRRSAAGAGRSWRAGRRGRRG